MEMLRVHWVNANCGAIRFRYSLHERLHGFSAFSLSMSAALRVGLVVEVANAGLSPGPDPISVPTTSPQTLASGTGTINSTGRITRSNSSPVIIISGTGSTLNNSGTIEQFGSDRSVRSSTASTSISLLNLGTVSVSNGAGGQAVDWNNILFGANSLTNHGMIRDTGEDAVRPGVNGIVMNMNTGTIAATPVLTIGNASSSDGIDGQLNTGISVTNFGVISGRHGMTGGDGTLALVSYLISITN